MHAMEFIMLSVLHYCIWSALDFFLFFFTSDSRHKPLLHIQWQKQRKNNICVRRKLLC